MPRGALLDSFFYRLQPADVRGRGALGAIFHFKAHAIALGEGLEAFHGDGGVVHKHVATAILTLDKTETLLITKPLYCSFCQSFFSYIVRCGSQLSIATPAKETILPNTSEYG